MQPVVKLFRQSDGMQSILPWLISSLPLGPDPPPGLPSSIPKHLYLLPFHSPATLSHHLQCSLAMCSAILFTSFMEGSGAGRLVCWPTWLPSPCEHGFGTFTTLRNQQKELAQALNSFYILWRKVMQYLKAKTIFWTKKFKLNYDLTLTIFSTMDWILREAFLLKHKLYAIYLSYLNSN